MDTSTSRQHACCQQSCHGSTGVVSLTWYPIFQAFIHSLKFKNFKIIHPGDRKWYVHGIDRTWVSLEDTGLLSERVDHCVAGCVIY